MGVGIGRHEVLAMQVNAVGVAKTDVGAFQELRPADAADLIDAKPRIMKIGIAGLKWR